MSTTKTVKQVRFAEGTVFKSGNGKAYRARFGAKAPRPRKSTKKPRFNHPNFQIDYQVETSFKVNFAQHYNTCMHLLLLDGVLLREQSKQERHKIIMAHFWEFKEETKISLKQQEAINNRRKSKRRKPKRKIQSLLKYCLMKNAIAACKDSGGSELEELKIKTEIYEKPPKNAFVDNWFDISVPLKSRGDIASSSSAGTSSDQN